MAQLVPKGDFKTTLNLDVEDARLLENAIKGISVEEVRRAARKVKVKVKGKRKAQLAKEIALALGVSSVVGVVVGIALLARGRGRRGKGKRGKGRR